MTYLYGGQDIKQGWKTEGCDSVGRKYPHFYCHKYGWTTDSIKAELISTGFSSVKIEDRGWNMRVMATKKIKTFNPAKSQLPIHFFTIVLNGQPFIRYHIDVFKRLPFEWHWHIMEGVADLKHDTAWSVKRGGRMSDELHRNGRSNDGTTEYLDDIAQSVSRKHHRLSQERRCLLGREARNGQCPPR